MYGLAAVARAQTSRPGGDHVRGCGGGSMVFIWAGNLSRDLVGDVGRSFIAGNCSRELAAWYGGRDFVRNLTNSPVVWWPGLSPRLKSSPVVWGPGLSR